jgi:hypothetical protein
MLVTLFLHPIIQDWQQKLGDYIKENFLQENNYHKNKVLSRRHTSNSSLQGTEKSASVRFGKISVKMVMV